MTVDVNSSDVSEYIVLTIVMVVLYVRQGKELDIAEHLIVAYIERIKLTEELHEKAIVRNHNIFRELKKYKRNRDSKGRFCK